MASIRRQVQVNAGPEKIWAAVRDVGAVHQRLAPGFVVNTKMEEGARVVTFANGMEARELIVDVDDTARRLVWSVVGTLGSRTTTPRCRSSPRVTGRAGSSGSRTCCRTRLPATSRE